MTFTIGQVFEGIYPPEAAVWANENNAHIVARDEGGFIIVENPEPEAGDVGADNICQS